MKKLPLILSIVSIVTVALLVVLDLTEKENNDSVERDAGQVLPADGSIAWVNVDTIIFNFEMYFDLRNDLMAKQADSEAELNSKGSQYENAAKDYDNKVRKGLVTRATAESMQQQLMQQQQDLVNLRDQLQSTLLEEEQVMNRKVLEYIYTYLNEYTVDKKYTYILGNSFGGQVMYSDPALDITRDVLKGVNEKYLAEKK